MRKLLIILFLGVSAISYSAKIYISPFGNDVSGNGSISTPYFTVTKAWGDVAAGDTIYVRGGTYSYTVTNTLSGKSGTSGNLISILNYPGENPVFDYSTGAPYTTQRIGFSITNVSYLKIRGIHVTSISQPTSGSIAMYGMLLWSGVTNSTFELMEFSYIGGWGVTIGDNCNNLLFLNCDSHHHKDPYSSVAYGWSDGFQTGSLTSTNITFEGCRAWSNSDDGWDLRNANGIYTLINCQAFRNGYIPDTWSTGGNGVGFKMGGKSTPSTTDTLRFLYNCIAFDNRLIGFNLGAAAADRCLAAIFYNCASFRNYQGFNVNQYTNTAIIRNCVSYLDSGGAFYDNAYTINDHNTFDIPLTVTGSSFASIDTSGVAGNRQIDGSVPTLSFLHLTSGSNLSSSGTYVGLVLDGDNNEWAMPPSIGAYEFRTILIIEDSVTANTDATWYGVNISRSVETDFTFKNSSITSQNTIGYLLQAGDENVAATNNNLDEAIITGNELSWVGAKTSSTITHGIFTGYNIDVTIKWNYLDVVPMGIVRKSNGMTDTQGVIAYNIFRSPEATAIAIKGMNGIRVYNNTFYSSNTTYTGPGAGTWRGLIDVYENDDPVAVSTGTKIKNNVFYTKNQIYNIYVYETSCLSGFESDYNVFYCEAGNPLFRIGSNVYTFTQWQTLGYDLHSVVVNPNFIDTVNFEPSARLNYGTDLGTSFNTGLAYNAVWGSGDPATSIQDATWQAGAVVISNSTYYVSPTGNDSNTGSITSPWATLTKAWGYVSPGDVIYMRGGTYSFSTIQTLNAKSGTAGNYISILPYPGEQPILTRAVTITGGTWPMALVRLTNSDYVHIKGIEITGFEQDTALASICSGLSLYRSDNCIIEQVSSHHNGHGILVYESGNTQILYCDTHHNYDPIDPLGTDPYGDGDGLEVTDMGEGTWTIIRGHRSWNNSDDGIDLWDSQKGVTVEGCWTWNNGYQEDGITEGGDGNGIKLGRLGSGIDRYTTHLRTIRNNVSFNNRQTGFNQNDTRCIIHLYNNTAFANPYGYHLFTMGTAVNQVRNNISFSNTSNGTFHSYDAVTNNTFLYTGATNTAYSLNYLDFISIDTTGARNARQEDGRLPLIRFMHLAYGSDLINAGASGTVTLDADEAVRDALIDIGAYEYKIVSTSYYISSSGGSDSNTGLSQAQAWATLAKVNISTFNPGDSVLFKRGDTFRGYLLFPSNGSVGNHIVIDAYGTGAKPKLLGSEDISSTSDWEVHSGNVWKTTATIGVYSHYLTTVDIANLIFNNEEFAGWRVMALSSVTSQGRYFFNAADSLIYLYSTSNPGSYYSHIECGGVYHENVVKFGAYRHHVTVRNIDVRYSGNNGIYVDRANNIIVEYCDVSWIGGWLYNVAGIRQGNGIGAWMVSNYTYDIIIRNNKVWQCYDAGISPQGSTNTSSNIHMYNNIVYECYYSYEWWCVTGQTNTGIKFYNNTCFDSGNCWSFSQRPDKNNSRHVMIWALTGTVSDCGIYNNIFSKSANPAMRIDDNWSKIICNYNIFNVDTLGIINETDKIITLASWRTATGYDLNSIDANPLFVHELDFHLNTGSPAIDAGINSGLTNDFEGTIRPVNSLYDIGAYEYYIGTPIPSGTGAFSKSRSGVPLKDSTGRVLIIQ